MKAELKARLMVYASSCVPYSFALGGPLSAIFRRKVDIVSARSARIEIGTMKLSTYLVYYPLSPADCLLDRSEPQKRLAWSPCLRPRGSHIIMRNAKNIYRLDLKIGANESWAQGASEGIHFVLCTVLLRARRAIKCHFAHIGEVT